MKWAKQGRIFVPEGQHDWVKTHAMCPIPEQRGEDRYRIYFSGRDERNRSLVGYLEIDINEPRKILRLSERPVLGLGELGCFDDNGVTPIWIVNHGGKKYMYYVGWNPRSSVRMSEMPGLAISTDGGESFNRVSRAPILERTDREPFSILAAPCVLIDNGKWRMWYVSGVEWVHPDFIRYNIKYAESDDGIQWRRDGITCIDFQTEDEHAFARPCVLKEDGIYKMWYSYKTGEENYRMGYAESADGLRWTRKDREAGIDVSENGWDSEMTAYAYVFEHKGAKYMLYNGNGYGKNGFGYAIWEQ